MNILKVIICHIVGDYLLQTDYMARKKSKAILDELEWAYGIV